MHYEPKTSLGRAINNIEESLIAIILGVMTIITFVNVIARYVFNANILWALEGTVFLFAWMVLLGMSYCVKTKTHLGVDAVINLVSPGARKVMAILSVGFSLLFAVLLMIGSWNYWAPFAGLPDLNGKLQDNAWYEVGDILMWDWLRFIEGPMNAGEHYEKLPRFIPYAALPIGAALMLFRYIETTLEVLRGDVDRIIAGHEAEDLVEEAAAKVEKE
jgi:C4-dicarboxylate transporter DctQ subunit